MVNRLCISGRVDARQGIRRSRFDERGIAYPRMKMSGAPRKEGARILDARVVAAAVAVPVLLVLTLVSGTARLAGVVAANAPQPVVAAAQATGYAARAVPARRLAVRPPRVSLASAGNPEAWAVLAGGSLVLLLIVMAG